jgi:hypothetical protein
MRMAALPSSVVVLMALMVMLVIMGRMPVVVMPVGI